MKVCAIRDRLLTMALPLAWIMSAGTCHADTLFLVSETAGKIGTYSSLSGTAINADFVTGLTTPHAIAFDPSLNFYVTGFTAGYVAKYAANGTQLSANYVDGAAISQPAGVAVNAAGQIFVVNNGYMYDPQADANINTVAKFGADGSTINPFYVDVSTSPDGIFLQPNGDMYVAIWANGAVGKYTSSGTSGTVVNSSFLQTEFNPWRPFNVARDSAGNFYVTGNDVVSKFAANGSLVSNSLISFSGAYGLAIDSQDNIFVGSYNGSTIGKFRPDGSAVNASFITGVSGVTNIAIQPVPEPSTWAMGLAAGASCGFAAWRRRRRA